MLFNSVEFLLFFLVLTIMYYAVPRKFQWILLLAGSCYFYACANVKFFLYIGTTAITIYGCSLILEKMNQECSAVLKTNKESWTKEKKKEVRLKYTYKKQWVIAGALLINFGILSYFKFFHFIGEWLNQYHGFAFQLESIIMPLGISFYTFSAIGYLIDVYRSVIPAEKNPARFLLFLSFFPQILQGPISRYNELERQLCEAHKFKYENLRSGCQLMLWGYFKKLVIADRLSILVTHMLENYTDLTAPYVGIWVFCVAIQDYSDFSGCMDIARGIAEVLDIRLPLNFHHPYFSRTVPEYWRRWHMTLGTWFKDYLFYPVSTCGWNNKLGQKIRKKWGSPAGNNAPLIVATIIVWLATGLWHGTGWNYIVWGIYYAVIMSLNVILKPVYRKGLEQFKINAQSIWWKGFQIIRTFLIVCVGKVLSRSENLKQASDIFGRLFRKTAAPFELAALGLDIPDLVVAGLAVAILIIVDVLQEKQSVRSIISRQKLPVRWCIYYAAIFGILLFGIYGPDFALSQFAYMKF